jgi:hypothetical protein
MVFGYAAKEGRHRAISVTGEVVLPAVRALARGGNGLGPLFSYRHGGSWRILHSRDVSNYIAARAGGHCRAAARVGRDVRLAVCARHYRLGEHQRRGRARVGGTHERDHLAAIGGAHQRDNGARGGRAHQRGSGARGGRAHQRRGRAWVGGTRE